MKELAKEREKDFKRRILIVDDEPINRDMLGFIVGNDYETSFAENGKQAYEIICREAPYISLILLDLQMPEMDGYALLDLLQADPALRRIPVIVLTSDKSAEVKSLRQGAVDFIPKPYDLPDVIMARIHRSIELAEDNSLISATETDRLTGLYNKEFFFEYCNRYDRFHPAADMDAVVLNVNRLHLINELQGREKGDAVLCSIARKLRAIAVEADGLAGRSNSDEFYMYVNHHDRAGEMVDRLIAAIRKDPETARVTVRVGVYPSVDKSRGIEQCFDRAIQACNTLPGTYVSGWALYDEKMHEQELYAERLVGEMETALREGQFSVFYQPKCDITGDRPVLCSAEALVRWKHPLYGFVSPAVFVPLFKKNGLILELDRFVWRTAAAQVRAWRDQYGKTIPVSVNISRVDMQEPHLADELLAITRECGLAPHEYLLEVTETAYTDDQHNIIDTVTAFRDHGFWVEMDDFGTGYSSLNMLATLPIDALKLDMRFVRNIATSPKDYRMVELMIEIAEFMSLSTIAEGVETAEQLALLRQAGCKIVQGYYFSKPVPPAEFAALIEKDLNQ